MLKFALLAFLAIELLTNINTAYSAIQRNSSGIPEGFNYNHAVSENVYLYTHDSKPLSRKDGQETTNPLPLFRNKTHQLGYELPEQFGININYMSMH